MGQYLPDQTDGVGLTGVSHMSAPEAAINR
jgi:hypothetical protein